MILNQAQSEAVYSAMCALNNVGGRIDALLEFEIRCFQMEDGSIVVTDRVRGPIEAYDNQNVFAAAYNLS